MHEASFWHRYLFKYRDCQNKKEEHKNNFKEATVKFCESIPNLIRDLEANELI